MDDAPSEPRTKRSMFAFFHVRDYKSIVVEMCVVHMCTVATKNHVCFKIVVGLGLVPTRVLPVLGTSRGIG